MRRYMSIEELYNACLCPKKKQTKPLSSAQQPDEAFEIICTHRPSMPYQRNCSLRLLALVHTLFLDLGHALLCSCMKTLSETLLSSVGFGKVALACTRDAAQSGRFCGRRFFGAASVGSSLECARQESLDAYHHPCLSTHQLLLQCVRVYSQCHEGEMLFICLSSLRNLRLYQARHRDNEVDILMFSSFICFDLGSCKYVWWLRDASLITYYKLNSNCCSYDQDKHQLVFNEVCMSDRLGTWPCDGWRIRQTLLKSCDILHSNILQCPCLRLTSANLDKNVRGGHCQCRRNLWGAIG